MDMSFHEKTLWLTLVGLLVAFGLYFGSVLPAAGVNVVPSQVGLFMLAVILLVATQVAGHIVIAILDRRPGRDERDRLIALRGAQYGAYVLAGGVFASLCAAVTTEGNFVFTQLLLGAWVLAQLVDTGSQLVLHRRGT